MSEPNIPVDEKHVDLRELENIAEDLEADARQKATVRSHSTFPINQLPREIIAEIFSNCLIHEPRETVWMSSGNAPLLLCRVCSSWRTLALALPQLWASVGILIRHPDDTDRSICTHITNAWLERSGILPLTITIDNGDYCASWPPIILDAILSVVCSHSSRWQNITVISWVPMSFPQLDILPILRAFQIQVFTNLEQKAISLPFSGSPRLTRLTWQYPLDAPIDPRIPWSQISYLHLTNNISFFAALETIRLCPQLEHFTTHLTTESIEGHHPTTVENHRLRTLTLDISGHPDYSPFFDLLILPELKEFTMSARSNAPSGRVAFLDFLTRSNCKLHKLELRYCAFEPFVECLEHESFKSIQELKIKFSPQFTDDELIRLTDFPSPPAPRVLLPKLTHLSLRLCLRASTGMLAEMVLSRRRQRDGHEAEPLQCLFVVNKELYKVDMKSIQDEVKQGFNGHIGSQFIICENGERTSL